MIMIFVTFYLSLMFYNWTLCKTEHEETLSRRERSLSTFLTKWNLPRFNSLAFLEMHSHVLDSHIPDLECNSAETAET